MARRLNLGWIWVALYTIAGAYALLHLLSQVAIDAGHLFNFGAAGFLGGALVSRFAEGKSIRESLLACFVVVIGTTLLQTLSYPEFELHQTTTYSRLASSLVVALAGSLGGSRFGALWAERVAYEGKTFMGAVLAAIVLVGALVCHVGLIAVFEEVNHRLAVFLVLLSILITPAFAGAALQLSQKEPVEVQVGFGLMLIAGAFLALIAWEMRSAGTVFLLGIAFLGIGATIYSVTLPGILTVRSSRFWSYRCNDIPVAVAQVASKDQELS